MRFPVQFDHQMTVGSDLEKILSPVVDPEQRSRVGRRPPHEFSSSVVRSEGALPTIAQSYRNSAKKIPPPS
jgi:hypothetical protein